MVTWHSISLVFFLQLFQHGRITVSFLTPLVCLFSAMYVFLDKSVVKQKQSKNMSFVGVHYDALPDQDERQKTRELSITEKFLVWWSIFMAMTWLFLQYVADQLSFQVITSLVFPNKSLYLIGHYSYYMLAHNIGRLFGRSYLVIVSVTCSRGASHVQVKQIWILAAFGNALMFWIAFASLFYLIGDIEVILVLCFIIGVLTGSTYANSL